MSERRDEIIEAAAKAAYEQEAAMRVGWPSAWEDVPHQHTRRAWRFKVQAIVAAVLAAGALRESVSPRPDAIVEALRATLGQIGKVRYNPLTIAHARDVLAAADAVGVSPPSPSDAEIVAAAAAMYGMAWAGRATIADYRKMAEAALEAAARARVSVPQIAPDELNTGVRMNRRGPYCAQCGKSRRVVGVPARVCPHCGFDSAELSAAAPTPPNTPAEPK